MTKHILTKEQRDAGLITQEDDHLLYIIDSNTGKVVNVFSDLAKIEYIQQAVNDYLINKQVRRE